MGAWILAAAAGRAGRELLAGVHRAARAARGRNERLKRFFRAILEVDRPAFDDLLVPLGLVRPGRGWDRERMWSRWRYHLEPYWAGDFGSRPRSNRRAICRAGRRPMRP